MVKIVVLGSSGNVGSAVIDALKKHHAHAHVAAGVRDPGSDKAKPLAGGNVTLVAADLGKPETLAAALHGADTVFVNTPGDRDRAQLALNGVQAAKQAGAKLVVVVSVLTAEVAGTIFGEQFTALEAGVKAAGVPYVLLRLPIFIDNLWGSKTTIAGQGKIYGPARPDAPYTPVAVQDIGLVAANLLAGPHHAAHANKTYVIAGPSTTEAAVAAAFATALGKPVDFVQVPFEAAKQAITGMGLADWQADGVLELYTQINAGSPVTNAAHSDIAHLAGRPATSVDQWIAAVALAFK